VPAEVHCLEVFLLLPGILDQRAVLLYSLLLRTGLLQGPRIAEARPQVVRRQLDGLPEVLDRLGQMDLGRLLLGGVGGLIYRAEGNNLWLVAEPRAALLDGMQELFTVSPFRL
jgi:hypothetical protein